MLRLYLGSVVAFGLVGCATIPLESRTEDDLCSLYYNPIRFSKVEVLEELLRRDLIDTDALRTIDRGNISVGMSKCQVYAAWGYPWEVNNYVSGNGRSQYLVYAYRGIHGYMVPHSSVYLRNGRVQSISQH